MGVERIPAITEALIAHGMNPETPVGMVRWGTTGRQQSIDGTLATIARPGRGTSVNRASGDGDR